MMYSALLHFAHTFFVTLCARSSDDRTNETMPAKKKVVGAKRSPAVPPRRSHRLAKRRRIHAPADVCAIPTAAAATPPTNDTKHQPHPKFDAETIQRRSVELFRTLDEVVHGDVSYSKLTKAVESMIADKCPLNCNITYNKSLTYGRWLTNWAHLGRYAKCLPPEHVTRGLFALIRDGGGIPLDGHEIDGAWLFMSSMADYMSDVKDITFLDCLLTLTFPETADEGDWWRALIEAYMQVYLGSGCRHPMYDGFVSHIIKNITSVRLLRELHPSQKVVRDMLANGATLSVKALFSRPEYVRNMTQLHRMEMARNRALEEAQQNDAFEFDGNNRVDEATLNVDTAACIKVVTTSIDDYLKSALVQVSAVFEPIMPRELHSLIVSYLLSSSLEWLFPPTLATTTPPWYTSVLSSSPTSAS